MNTTFKHPLATLREERARVQREISVRQHQLAELDSAIARLNGDAEQKEPDTAYAPLKPTAAALKYLQEHPGRYTAPEVAEALKGLGVHASKTFTGVVRNGLNSLAEDGRIRSVKDRIAGKVVYCGLVEETSATTPEE